MCIVNYKIFKVLLIKHFKSKIKFISNKGLFLRSGKWQYFRIPPPSPLPLIICFQFFVQTSWHGVAFRNPKNQLCFYVKSNLFLQYLLKTDYAFNLNELITQPFLQDSQQSEHHDHNKHCYYHLYFVEHEFHSWYSCVCC